MMVQTENFRELQCENCGTIVQIPIFTHPLYGDCLRASDVPPWTFKTDTKWLCESCAFVESGDE